MVGKLKCDDSHHNLQWYAEIRWLPCEDPVVKKIGPSYWDPVNRFNHTSWVAIVTLTDRPVGPQSLCNRRFWRRLCCHIAFWVFLWV